MPNTSNLPDPIYWKHEFLTLSAAIERFQQEHLPNVVEFRPPADDPSQGNVSRLLNYHLARCRELLWSEVNGGLDETYQDEVDALEQTINQMISEVK